MKPYSQYAFTTFQRGMALILFLFVVHGAYGQASNHNTTRSNRTSSVAASSSVSSASTGQARDDDSDDDGLVRVDGRVTHFTESVLRFSMHVSSNGDDPVTRKRPGRTSISEVTLSKEMDAQAVRVAPAQDYNSSRSNRSSVSSTDGSLEHTDDWIAARATASSLVLTLVSVTEQPTDVHSGKLTGVRQHSRASSSPPVDAASPQLYRCTVGDDGAFAFENVAPGTYDVCVSSSGPPVCYGHVTVLK